MVISGHNNPMAVGRRAHATRRIIFAARKQEWDETAYGLGGRVGVPEKGGL
jgi:hypothetical protein